LFFLSVFFLSTGSGGGGTMLKKETAASMEDVRINKSLQLNVVVQVVCGAEHTLCINMGGHVYAWGENSDGQLGMGDNEDR
jgi:alpha-tubulin suppressor-like RCC1 family protein